MRQITPIRKSKKAAPKSHSKKVSKELPIPKGYGPYVAAKRAEYEGKDLNLAEKYYLQAINEEDKKFSAIKDLASLY